MKFYFGKQTDSSWRVSAEKETDGIAFHLCVLRRNKKKKTWFIVEVEPKKYEKKIADKTFETKERAAEFVYSLIKRKK